MASLHRGSTPFSPHPSVRIAVEGSCAMAEKKRVRLPGAAKRQVEKARKA